MVREALSIAAGLLSAFLVYAACVVVSVTASILNGEGIACRDAECGAVADFVNATAPWLMIAVVTLAVGVGVVVGRRLWPNNA